MRQNRRPSQIKQARGIALLSVLWVLILMSVLAVGLLRASSTQVNLARNAVDQAQAEALAEAGLNLAVLKMLEPRNEDRWRADGSVYQWRFGEGVIRIAIQDEAGKIDLNAAEPALIRALFEAAGVEALEADALSDALADYRDGDSDPRANGAEDDAYDLAGYAHEAKDAPFAIIEELRLVFGMTAALYDRLAPSITVYSRQGQPAPELADPLVKAALEGRIIEDYQIASIPYDETAFEEIEATGEPFLLQEGTDGTVAAQSGFLSIHVEARTNNGAVFVRDAVVRLVAGRQPPYHSLAWRRGQRFLFAAQATTELEDTE